MQISHQFTSPASITRQYACWFDERIDEFIDKHKNRFESRSMFKSRNGFFATISFDQNRRMNRPEGSDEIELSELERFTDIYNRICRQIIGRNYHRQSFQDQLPLAIGCLDANGSRYWRSIGEIENLHVHSIWILTDQTRDRFLEFLNEGTRFVAIKERFSIRAIDIQPMIDDRRNQTGESCISSYTAKFIGHNNDGLGVPSDFAICPTS